MSWSVEIQREEGKVVAGVYSTVPCAPICVLDCASERLDADNLRILIDALHTALDILDPDFSVKNPAGERVMTLGEYNRRHSIFTPPKEME